MRSRQQQQARVRQLSTNNKNFVSGARILPGTRQDLAIHDDVLDDNVRLERVRKGHHAERNASQYGNRETALSNKVLEESRNGYKVTAGAPSEPTAAVKHFTTMLRRYTLDFPEEWALCHFFLGKIFFSDHRETEDRCKALENAIFHFKTCSSVFTAESYPMMWALTCLFSCSLYRERAMLIRNRDFTMSRGSAIQSVQLGIDMAEESLNILAVKEHRMPVEQGFNRLELGWLLFLAGDYQVDSLSAYDYSQLLERSVSQLEKASTIFIKCTKMDTAAQKLQSAHGADNESRSPSRQMSFSHVNLRSSSSYSLMSGNTAAADSVSLSKAFQLKLPSADDTYHHICLLLAGKTLVYYAGLSTAILGASYYGLATEGDVLLSKDNRFIAYENLTECLKQKYGLKESEKWVEARCLLASLILKDPQVLTGNSNEDVDAVDTRLKAVNPDDAPKGLKPQVYGKVVDKNTLVPSNAFAKPPDSSMAIEAAVSHLNIARQNPMSRRKLTEIHFLSGQAHFAKLHFLSDKVVTPASFSRPMPDGSSPADVMVDAEDHYQAALKRVSAMSKNGIDSYIYFLCSLKIAELRVLQAVAINNVDKKKKDGTQSQSSRNLSLQDSAPTKADRDYLFQSALKYLMDSLHCRKPEENIDVHFLASSQMGYLLSIGPKREVAVHCFVRALFCMSCMIIRSRFFCGGSNAERSSLEHEDFFRERKQIYHSLFDMAGEAQRLAAMALLSSLKLVEWAKSSKTGEAKRSGFCLWSFEKEPAVATRIQTLTGSSLAALQRMKSTRSMASLLNDPSARGENMYVGAFSNKKPHRPSEPLSPEKATKNRSDNDSMVDYQRATNQVMIPLSKRKSRSRLTSDDAFNGSVKEEVIDEEQVYSYKSPIRRSAQPMYDAKGHVVDVPYAPSHIKPPEMEYEDVTVKKVIKKKVQPDSFSDLKQPSIISLNQSFRSSVSAYDELDNETLPSSHKKPASFMEKLSQLFSSKHRTKMRRRIYKMAHKSVSDLLDTHKKFKESIASAEVVKEVCIEVIGTEHCVFGLMLLSHLYRQMLALRVLELDLSKGARVQHFMNTRWVSEHILPQMKRAHQGLKKAFEDVTPCPWTLQGLSEACTKKDIRRIFKSQSRASSLLLQEENTITAKLSKVDPFLSLTLSLPSYNRLAVESSTKNEFSLDEEAILGAYDQKKSVVDEVVTPQVRLRREGEKTKTAMKEMNANFQPLENFTTTPLGIPSGGTIGVNAVSGGEGRRTWASYLDSTHKGVDKMLAEHLKPNEALIQWHIFTSSLTSLGNNSYPLQAMVVWKEMVEDIVPFAKPGVGIVAAEILAKKAMEAAKKYGSVAQQEAKKAMERAKKLRNEALLRTGRISGESFVDEGDEGNSGKDDESDEEDEDEEAFDINDEFEIRYIEKVFMEYARSDVDMAQIQFALQSWVDAIHSRPAPIRESKCTSALSLLSDCFAMTELLTKLPPEVDTLIICYPSVLSVVPWHLITVDDVNRRPTEGPSGILGRQPTLAHELGPHEEDMHTTKRVYLNEKFTVVCGQTLPILEINAIKAVKLDHAPGKHKLCFVDADDNQELPMTNVEVGAVTSLWSSDIWDYSLLEGVWASHEALSTAYSDNQLIMAREKQAEKKRKSIEYRRKLRKNKHALPPIKDMPHSLRERTGFKKKLHGKAAYDQHERENSVVFGTVVDSEGEKDDLGALDEEALAAEEEKIEEAEEELVTRHRTSKALTGCRVLHLCAIRQVDPQPPRSAAKSSTSSASSSLSSTASFQLPAPGTLGSEAVRYDARKIVANLYLENCALTVLSRVGVLDSLSGNDVMNAISSGGSYRNTVWDLVEAFHLAGAPSVVLPLWGGGSFGGDMGQLARMVLFIRFYFELPNQAHHSRPVARALQLTQLWMKDSTVGEIIDFIGKAPLPEKNSEEVQDELRILAKASCSKKKQASSGYRDIILFDHFFYWGMLTMIGDGRGVHPKGVGGDDEVEDTGTKTSKATKQSGKTRRAQQLAEKGPGASAVESHVTFHESEYQNESAEGSESEESDGTSDEADEKNLSEIDKMKRELKWLRMEGSKTEAEILEREIRKLKRRQAQQRILDAKKKFEEFKVSDKLADIKADVAEAVDKVDKSRRKKTLLGRRIWKGGEPVQKNDDLDEEEALGRIFERPKQDKVILSGKGKVTGNDEKNVSDRGEVENGEQVDDVPSNNDQVVSGSGPNSSSSVCVVM